MKTTFVKHTVVRRKKWKMKTTKKYSGLQKKVDTKTTFNKKTVVLKKNWKTKTTFGEKRSSAEKKDIKDDITYSGPHKKWPAEKNGNEDDIC